MRRTDDGEQHITQSKALAVSHERFLEILDMGTDELRTLPTSEKVIHLKAMIDKHTPPLAQGVNKLNIRREEIIQDSLARFKSFYDLRRALKITFENEISQDRGGLSREFFE